MSGNSDDNSPAELLQAHYRTWSLSMNYMQPMALRCALELRIPDIISNHDRGAVTLSELVDQLSIPPTKSIHLSRIMQLLVHLGYFAIQKNDQDQEEAAYTLTSSSKLLFSDTTHHPTLAPFVLLTSDPILQTPSFYLADWLRGPHSSAFEAINGASAYQYSQKHPEFNTIINKANASTSQLEARGMLQVLLPMLEGFESLVDVGGGTGLVAGLICESLPHMRCTVFDLPAVISEAKHSDTSNNATGVTFVAGDMFESIPSADVIFFKSTSIAFRDARVLKQCREILGLQNNQGKVILVDTIKNQGKVTFESITSELCYDLYMMSLGSGIQKDESEWNKLFVEAGFTSYKITPTLGLFSIIEVFP